MEKLDLLVLLGSALGTLGSVVALVLARLQSRRLRKPATPHEVTVEFDHERIVLSRQSRKEEIDSAMKKIAALTK